jgi:hypothetical protein
MNETGRIEELKWVVVLCSGAIFKKEGVYQTGRMPK